MSDNVCIVVGEEFKAFVNNNNILSPLCFGDNFDEKKFDSIYFGQGLSHDDVTTVRAMVGKNITFSKKIEWVNQEIVHKNNKKNILISSVNKINDRNFSFKIRINKGNEMLSDHVTGIHVPGLMLIEAARQSLISVLEVYFKDLSINSRFVINSISSEFVNYVYPLEICGAISIRKMNIAKLESKLEAEISITQYSKVCAKFNLTTSLTPEKLAVLTEKMSVPKKIEVDYA